MPAQNLNGARYFEYRTGQRRTHRIAKSVAESRDQKRHRGVRPSQPASSCRVTSGTSGAHHRPSDESKKERRDAICRPHSGPPTLGAARRTRGSARTCEIIRAKRKEAGRNKCCRQIGRRVRAHGRDRTGRNCDSADRVLPDFSCRPASSGASGQAFGTRPDSLHRPAVFFGGHPTRTEFPTGTGFNRHLGLAAGPAAFSRSAQYPSRCCNPGCTGDRVPHAP